MTAPVQRPFYGEFAWAYDLIIPAPAQARCAFWSEMASARGVHRGSRVLDAGCGTGAYALELARMGYAVAAIDASPDLIAIAKARCEKTRLHVGFSVADILELPGEPRYDGILCRGVLNDFVTDADRCKACARLGRVLRSDGLLVLDVREWHATAQRKTRQPIFERKIETARGALSFSSRSELDVGTRRLLVSEQHILAKGKVVTTRKHRFVMRCWTEEELCDQLTAAGFRCITLFGDYVNGAPLGTTDRIVAVASH